ncbi:hypothetical protein, partial [Plasmodium yoelii yoelii]
LSCCIELSHMFHHLYKLPSIPLNFVLANILLRRNIYYYYAFAFGILFCIIAFHYFSKNS